MSRIIKEVTVQNIAKLVEGMEVNDSKVINLQKFFRDLQGNIIVSILVGKGIEEKLLPYETETGVI